MFQRKIRNGRLTKFVVMSLCFASFSIATGSASVIAAVHELEDGVIEKTVSVVVRDHTATLQLAIGINPSTMNKQLEKWEAESKEQVGETDPAATADDVESIENRFRQYAFQRFSEEIKISIDQRKMPLTKVSVEPSSRHHFSLIATYSFEIPKRQRVELIIEDQTLKSMKGGSRYSLKAAGKSILFKSNVAPIIVRAKRNELAKLTEKQLAKVSRIEAQVGGTFAVAEKSDNAIKSTGGTDATDSKKKK